MFEQSLTRSKLFTLTAARGARRGLQRACTDAWCTAPAPAPHGVVQHVQLPTHAATLYDGGRLVRAHLMNSDSRDSCNASASALLLRVGLLLQHQHCWQHCRQLLLALLCARCAQHAAVALLSTRARINPMRDRCQSTAVAQ